MMRLPGCLLYFFCLITKKLRPTRLARIHVLNVP